MKKDSLIAKVALVTGSAKRIGAEIAKTLHKEGMNIVLHYHLSEEEAISFCQELNQLRDNSAVAVPADLLDNEAIKSLVKKAHQAWKRLDVLVNNASKFYKTFLGKVTPFAWDDLINSNLKAPFFLAQACAPYLAEQEGAIINIADIHGERPMKDYSVYCISKSGLIMMTKVLAKELGPKVRVNTISPGVVLWPVGEENSLSEEEKQKIISHTSLLRTGTPQDIAKAVLFFVRDGAYVTGQMLNVDGGRMIT